MDHFVLYRVAAGLLALGFLGHTLGGMLKTGKSGPGSGPEADKVLADMKSVRFMWRGSECTWYKFWMGNGLGVSALLIMAIAVLWTLGGMDPAGIKSVLPIAWAAFVSLALLAALGFKYFVTRVGIVFALIAVLVGAAVVLSTLA